MLDSQIKLWIEKSSDGLNEWIKTTSSFIDSTISIYNNNSILQETRDLNYYFTSSYSTIDSLYIIYNSGSIIGNSNFSYITWNINPKLNEPITSSYQYRLAISSSNHTDILFNPIGFNNPKQWELEIDNPFLQPSVTFSPSSGSYWEFYSGSRNEIILKSEGGNYFYDRGFYQSQLPYSASFNSRYKGGLEPIDTQFPNINDEWSLIIGDQIRFENDERKSFDVTDISFTEEFGSRQLILTVDRNIPDTTNLNFFLIRRFKTDPNNIIINRTFPYTNPLLSASLAPSTSGFIFPKYPIDEIANNPDKIIRDLIDKKIIE